MTHNFYSHLVEIESVIVELDRLELSETEKKHLASLIDANLQHTILDAILSQLNQEDKKNFLKHLEEQDHQQIWQFLTAKIDNIEEKIKVAAQQLKKELHEDIKQSKNKK